MPGLFLHGIGQVLVRNKECFGDLVDLHKVADMTGNQLGNMAVQKAEIVFGDFPASFYKFLCCFIHV